MYFDDFDSHLDRCCPGHDELLPPAARLGRRALGLALTALLVLLHACS